VTTDIDGAPIDEHGYEYLRPGYPGADATWQVWVPPGGWLSCADYGADCEDRTRRRASAEIDKPRTPWDQLDTCRTYYVTCPYCGHEDRDGGELFGSSYDDEDAENECHKCNKLYYISRQVEAVYSTKRKGE
jgi:hypothetical protein